MDLIGIINQIIQQNREASKPTELAIGTVTSVNPLSVKINVDMAPLPEAVLLLTDAVKDFDEDITATSSFASLLTAAGISLSEGDVIGKVTHPGLAVNDKVIMIRVMAGQQYIILSKV